MGQGLHARQGRAQTRGSSKSNRAAQELAPTCRREGHGARRGRVALGRLAAAAAVAAGGAACGRVAGAAARQHGTRPWRRGEQAVQGGGHEGGRGPERRRGAGPTVLLEGAAAAGDAEVLGRPGAVLSPQVLQAGGHRAEEAQLGGGRGWGRPLRLQAALPRLQAAAAPAPLLALGLLLLLLRLGLLDRLGQRRRLVPALLALPGRLLVVTGRWLLVVVRLGRRPGRRGPQRQGRPHRL